ncbi:thioredoxin domain-containing protein [Clostridium ganghwense]|uniref:Thioredoxin domain-containing protein n=1 Tax=Clostridium ganghwense TaxID=312089 RepID=A0ABT4CPP3_9CLOT|nr:thioredoxin domain-containing protein [Clostridium ganghwense]MCY6370923.1 thioredoxin domain-containing protein [Clostridium ganghwense]
MSTVMAQKTNRLINEKSPYLLQHAHNPVDWYPWCEEAFEKAKEENKPIFLSIGYSTCHWCHVMEKESFEDEEVAKILNENFISIKVDREERPDVDSVYMNACQIMNGTGGWPLTIIMTPDKKPFFAGTYYPKESRNGMHGITEILNYVIKVWRNNEDEILNNSEEIFKYIKQMNTSSPEPIESKSIERAFEELRNNYEINYGGFSRRPKFPSPQNLYFLLRYYKQTGSERALNMVTKTLDSMYKGGIFDHVGYGFSRYSTDEKWLVPHFEKMLYDNALLAIAYTEAYVVTGKKLYKEVTEKIFSYVLRDMQDEYGAFYCAEDADSEGVEGKFYLWTYDEIREVLGDDDSELFCKYYGISKKGNFEGKNIPNLIDCNLEKLYEDNRITDRLEDITKKLFEARERREHPHKDDKILTSWNGLMIAALSYCGRVLENDMYIENAKKTVSFIYKKLINDEGRLLARYRKGEAMYLGYIDDYAFLLWGLVELYEATFEGDYLNKAIDLTKDMEKYFWDDKKGAFFLYGSDAEELIWRPKEIYDGAIPSGNSVAALNMLRLARMTKNMDVEKMVSRMFTSLGGKVQNMPSAYAYFMMVVMYGCAGGKEIVIAGDMKDSETKKIIGELNKEYLPFSTVLLNNNQENLKEIMPNLENNKKVDNKTTVYICENFVCREPLTDIDRTLDIIKGKEMYIPSYYPDLS